MFFVNFRPISTLPFLSKIIEKAVHSRIVIFINKYNILFEDQFGFRKDKSTCDALLKFTELCYTCLNNKKVLLSVFLDFSKAFDTVDIDMLLKKLNFYGFRGFMLDWFRSYIFNRTQYVDINGHFSPVLTMKYGVGQVTILAPFLFLLYINDMHFCSDLDFIHFADDSTVFKVGDSVEGLCVQVNEELDKIDKWLCANRLSLNVSKSAVSM